MGKQVCYMTLIGVHSTMHLVHLECTYTGLIIHSTFAQQVRHYYIIPYIKLDRHSPSFLSTLDSTI